MRVVIYGAGAVGGTVAGHLARFGNEVVLVCRDGQAKAIQEQGLKLITPSGTYTLRVQTVTAPGQIVFGSDDVVYLCIKGQSTEETIRDLRVVAQDLPVFCFQNGVRNEEIATRYFSRAYGVRVFLPSVYLTDGEVIVRREPPGSIIMGRYPTGTDDLVDATAAKLRSAGFPTMITPNIMPYKWGKLLLNLVNAIDAITNSTEDETDVIGKAAQREARDILTQAGIRWISEEELALEWPESTIKPRRSLSVEAKSSTWQSLARQQGSVETEFLNGEIVRLAKKLGRNAPVNEGLLRISQEMAAKRERPGKYTAAQLSALLGLSNRLDKPGAMAQ